MTDDSTTRFTDRVDRYVKYRPTYPTELLTFLEHEIELRVQSVIADIGSGTGISSQLLLSHGNEVFAVEPNLKMRTAAERLLSSSRRFHSIDGTASATTLPDASIDVITVMQAFHWFNPQTTRTEFHRILKPGGWVVLVWNDRQSPGSPFLQAYEQLLIRHAPDYASVRRSQPSLTGLDAFFAPGICNHTTLFNQQTFDYDGLAGRLLSSSYAPAEGHAGHAAMMEELRRIFDQHQLNGQVQFLYDTQVYFGRLPSR